MRIVFIAELKAYDPRAGAVKTLYACNSGQGPLVYGDEPYKPCLNQFPTYSFALSENGEAAEPAVDYGAIGLTFDSDLDNADWRGFDFDGYPCTLMWGEYGEPLSAFRHVPAGRTGSMTLTNVNTGTIPLLGPESDLKKEILTAEFAGNGAAEGAEDHKGVLKPFAVGPIENIEADPVDLVYLVYQYHGYGPTDDVVAVYENALTLGEAKYRVDSYAQLIGLTNEQLPPGTWAKAPAVGMFRLGAEPTGKITLDVGGALDENGETMTTFGKIACWMLHTIAGIPKAQIDYASADKLDRDFPHTWGNYINSQDKPEDETEPAISVGDFLRDGANQLGAYMISDEHGVFRFGRNVATKAPMTIQQGRTTWPVVTSINKPATTMRAWKVRIGGRRCFVTHNDDEISSALKDAIEEVAVGVGEAVKDITDDVNAIRNKFRDFAKEALMEDIADISALHLQYGAGIATAQIALHNQNHVAIQGLSTRVNENGELVAEFRRQLTTRVETLEGNVESGFIRIEETIASEKAATVQIVEAGIASYKGTVDAAFTALRNLQASDNEARASENRSLDVRVGGTEGRLTVTEGKISAVERLVATPSEATLEIIREAGVKITDEYGQAIEAAKQDVTTAIVGPNGAATTQFGSMTTRFGVIEGKIQELETASSGPDGATAGRITTLESRLSPTNSASYEQNVQTLVNLNGTASSSVVFKTQTNVGGRIVLGGLGIFNQNGTVATAITTDFFDVWTPNGAQRILGADASGVYFDNGIIRRAQIGGAQIDNLTVDTLKIAGNAITSNTFHTAADAYCPAGGTIDFLNTGFFNIGDAYDGSAVVSVSFTIDATAYYDAASFVELFLDNGSGYRSVASGVIGISTDNGNTYWRTSGMLIGGIDGSNVRVLARINSGQHTPRSVARSFYVRNIAMTIIGAKR